MYFHGKMYYPKDASEKNWMVPIKNGRGQWKQVVDPSQVDRHISPNHWIIVSHYTSEGDKFTGMVTSEHAHHTATNATRLNCNTKSMR